MHATKSTLDVYIRTARFAYGLQLPPRMKRHIVITMLEMARATLDALQCTMKSPKTAPCTSCPQVFLIFRLDRIHVPVDAALVSIFEEAAEIQLVRIAANAVSLRRDTNDFAELLVASTMSW